MARRSVLFLALGALLVACATPSGTGLTNTTWKWSASTTTTPPSQSVVPKPDDYTILFKPNQTFEAKADCNQVSGSWSTDTGNGIDIKLGPSTLAACGADSLAPQFTAGLDKASAYVLDSNGLNIVEPAESTSTPDNPSGQVINLASWSDMIPIWLGNADGHSRAGRSTSRKVATPAARSGWLAITRRSVPCAKCSRAWRWATRWAT